MSRNRIWVALNEERRGRGRGANWRRSSRKLRRKVRRFEVTYIYMDHRTIRVRIKGLETEYPRYR
jgi:hypothetical protein